MAFGELMECEGAAMKSLFQPFQSAFHSKLMGFVAFMVCLGCPIPAHCLSYSARPISAVVIDAETKQPLEGVIALVIWELQNSDGGGGGYWIFDEAVSDSEGRFSFPGWGPKQVPRMRGEPQWRLGPDQPTIFLFKSEYVLESVFNPWESWMLGNRMWTGDLVRSSIWSGKTIELQRFKGGKQEYLAALSRRAGRLPLQACRWAKIPRFTAALIKVRGDQFGPLEFYSLPTLDYLEEDAKRTPDCKGLDQIRKYLQ